MLPERAFSFRGQEPGGHRRDRDDPADHLPVSVPAFAQSASNTHDPSASTAPVVATLNSRSRCARTGLHLRLSALSLSECTCGTAAEMRGELAQQIALGKDRDQIRDCGRALRQSGTARRTSRRGLPTASHGFSRGRWEWCGGGRRLRRLRWSRNNRTEDADQVGLRRPIPN
jgi:hypothetical protein